MNPGLLRAVVLVVIVAVVADCARGGDEEADMGAEAEVSATGTEGASTSGDASDSDSGDPTWTVGDDNAPLDPLDIRGDIIRQHELVSGDCFNRLEDLRAGRKVIITTRVGCDEEHVYEVFHTFDLDVPHPSIHPGDTKMNDYTRRLCYDHFEAFVGEIYELSEYEIGVFAPDRVSFEHDIARYRGVHCWLHRTDMKPTAFSARGPGMSERNR